MATSPTKRTLDWLRKDGWTCEVVEHWNPFARRRIDLFGIIDIVAVKPGVVMGIQATTASNKSARVGKLKGEPKTQDWLAAGAQLEIWTWSKVGPRGKRKTWKAMRTEIKMNGPQHGAFNTVEALTRPANKEQGHG